MAFSSLLGSAKSRLGSEWLGQSPTPGVAQISVTAATMAWAGAQQIVAQRALSAAMSAWTVTAFAAATVAHSFTSLLGSSKSYLSNEWLGQNPGSNQTIVDVTVSALMRLAGLQTPTAKMRSQALAASYQATTSTVAGGTVAASTAGLSTPMSGSLAPTAKPSVSASWSRFSVVTQKTVSAIQNAASRFSASKSATVSMTIAARSVYRAIASPVLAVRTLATTAANQATTAAIIAGTISASVAAATAQFAGSSSKLVLQTLRGATKSGARVAMRISTAVSARTASAQSFSSPALPQIIQALWGAWSAVVNWARTSIAVSTRVFQATYQQRSWTIVDESMLYTTKDPRSTEDFLLDWAIQLGTTDVIASSNWMVQSGLTLVQQSFTGTSATARLSGGTLNQTYDAANVVTLASGQTKVRHLQITIQNA